ncbi:hypothetical protein IJI31_05275 [bacterium]|nr:hypothetical protein [bacterium]
MKKALLLFCTLFCLTILTVFADDMADVRKMFDNYVQAANTYSTSIPDFYSPNAKIIRQVVKPDGTTVNATTDMATYTKQMKLSQSIAKVRKYTNKYFNISVSKVPNGYKVSALRSPLNDNDNLKIYQIWKKQNGKWVIVEEMMQTRQQIFLKYADKE